MKRLAIFVLAVLILPSLTTVAGTTGRSTNIDLAVGDISITYPDSTNRSMYQMFSSNYPIIGFTKPENLYVTDGVLGVEMNINIEIQNIGTAQSGFIDVQVYVLHNEYTRFELLNFSTGMSPIAGSASSSTDILWIPQYSGNHTLQVIVSNNAGDDDTTNNQKNRHMTIAYSYDNCADMSLWTSTGDWNVNGDAFITSPSAFHIGNGEFSTYAASRTSTLTTPIMNLANDVSGHNAAIGYSFFYTGGANTGDSLIGYALDDGGNWDQTFTLQNVVDNDFQDGSNNWQTFTASYNGKNSPLIPLSNEHFHSNSQFRFEFTSDASSEDIGYWFDEFVIIYDQAARKSEFNIDLSGVNTFGGLPGDWSITRLQAENIGNISARYTPEVFGVPEGWTYYFSNTNGANIGSSGLEILPGESKIFDLRVLVDENASQGNLPVIVNMTSNTHSDITDSISSSVKVLPSRVPDIIQPEFTPRCKPGDTCNFQIELQNIGEATDVFDITIEDKNVPQGWSISLAWNQSTSILVRTDSPRFVWLTATVPAGIEPDITAEVYLTATSTNDTRRFDTEVIDVAAAMTSDAEITNEAPEMILVDAGESVDITMRIWNNASRIDIFRPTVTHTELPGWTVVVQNTPDLAISPGSSSVFTIRISAPTTAQAGDIGPMISAKAISLRSGEEIIGDGWQGIKVRTYHNLSLEILDSPETMPPGIPFAVDIKITNNGNGPDTATLDLPWSPNTWDWWAFSDGVNVTEGIELSAPYDLENERIVNVWILLDSLESAGEIHEITLSAISSSGTDIYDEDNHVMFEAITEMIKQPRLDGYFGEIVVETNSSHAFNATAWNIGNAVDSTIRTKLIIQTSPPSSCVVGFISTNTGLSKPSGEWMSLNLGPTQSTELVADVIVGSDCDLNTIISAKIQLEGGADELGRPIMKELTAVLMVGERRNVDVDFNSLQIEPIDNENTHVLWYNFTSTSTKSEIFDINATLPEGWGMICDGIPIHLNPTRIELNEGHINSQIHNMRCEIIREGGDLTGEITLHISGSDDRINQKISQELAWNPKPVEDGLFANQNAIVVGSVIGIIILGAVIFFVMRKPKHVDDEYEIEKYDSPTVGPPASAVFETAATIQTAPASEDPAMIEYQRQVEEYNRQMAEYQAWQASQGSQPKQ